MNKKTLYFIVTSRTIMNDDYYCEVGCEGSMALPCGCCTRSQFDGFPEFKQILSMYENGQMTLDDFFTTMFLIRDAYLLEKGINVAQFEKNHYQVEKN